MRCPHCGGDVASISVHRAPFEDDKGVAMFNCKCGSAGPCDAAEAIACLEKRAADEPVTHNSESLAKKAPSKVAKDTNKPEK